MWDPELGPEEECPYCFNELGEFRSVTFRMGADEEEPGAAGRISSQPDDEDEADDDEDFDSDLDEADGVLESDLSRNAYRENAERIIDEQEFAPECTNCRELMLFGGKLQLAGNGFLPHKPLSVERELLPEILEMGVYVCPACFKTDTYLGEPGRLRLTQVLGGE